jgi:plastocyanin
MTLWFQAPVRPTRLTTPVVLAAMLAMSVASPARAQTAPSLGTAQSVAVLGGSTVTNTGPTIVHGNLGVAPGTAVTGFPPGLIIAPGALHSADAVAVQAQLDTTTAYNALASQPCTQTFLPTDDLAGKTLVPGVYCFTSSAQLTGALTLNGGGNANAVFIFKIGSTLTTASGSTVRLINGAQACNVFWQVGSSAVLGTNTSFIGNILALSSITLTTGTNLNGRALARNGAVTLDTNNVFYSTCTPQACLDTTAPTVGVTGVSAGTGGHTEVSITAQDTGCGLASISVITATNTSVAVPIFTPGTTAAVVSVATKVTVGAGSVVGLMVVDVNGNVTIFDPVDFTLKAGQTVTLADMPREERWVTIVNDGLQSLNISINGRRDRTVWPANRESFTIVLRGMKKTGNTISFEGVGFGNRGSALILVAPK